MIYFISTIFVLGILIFVHELGHFLAARACGIRVDKFSLGFGPKLFGKTVGQTEYMISWVPLGGYCKMAGMIDESLDDSGVTGAPDEYQSKPVPAKLFAVIAGPGMNFLLAFVIYVSLALFVGVADQKHELPIIGDVMPGYPAAAAGLQSGDRITEINGQPVQTWNDLTSIIHARPEQDLAIGWTRAGAPLSATIRTLRQTQQQEAGPVEVGMIGIGPELEMVPVGPVEALTLGGREFLRVSGEIFNILKMLLTGQESIKSLGGPLMIAQMAGQSANQGFPALLTFMAFLSVNLALLNLLPVPILDGGHVVLVVVEGIIRRPLPVKWKMAILQTGFVLLMALMAFIIYNDVLRLMKG